MKSAAQLYTLREFTKTEKDFFDTIKKVKAMGYSSFQLSGAGPMEAADVRAMTDEIQLPVSATHISHALFTQSLDKVIQDHKTLGCKYVGLGAMPKTCMNSYSELMEFAKTYSDIAQELDKEGLRFVYHNHAFEFFKFDDKTALDILLENTHDSFHFEIDTYWVQAGGADPVEWIRKTKNRCEYIHFKDLGINAELSPTFKPIGQGNLNWDKIINECRASGVLYCAVEQDQCEGSPFDALTQSYNYLKSMGVE